MTSTDGSKLLDFMNTSSTSIMSALGKQSGKMKRKANHRKLIEKNRQKAEKRTPTAKQTAGAKPACATSTTRPRSQSKKLQQYYHQNDMAMLPHEGAQYLPPWQHQPVLDSSYTGMPCVTRDQLQAASLALSVPSAFEQEPLMALMQQTSLDLPRDFSGNCFRDAAPITTTASRCSGMAYDAVDTYSTTTVEYFSDSSRPLTPYEAELASAQLSDKDFEDLLIDQYSPGSCYSSSPVASGVPSPTMRACDGQMIPTSYAVYDNHMLYH